MKRSNMKILLVLLVLLLILSFVSCSGIHFGYETDLYTGDVLTPEDIESILSSMTFEVTDKYPIETDDAGNMLVFWLKGGSVWHISKECASIENADPQSVFSGSEDDAVSAGKSRACKVCSVNTTVTTDITDFTSDSDSSLRPIETTVKYPKNYDSDGKLIVFWVDGGSVWHESENCPNVIRSEPENVKSGDVYSAYYAGKTRPCKICSSDSNEVIDRDEITTGFIDGVDQSTEDESRGGANMVYWVENGTVWHESKNCSSLSRTDEKDIISGSEEEAKSANKERACKKCSG